MPLQTGWLKLATSGPTIDGREITEQEVLEMAESYDMDEYSASIWDNHYRWYKFGKVIEVKAEKDGKGRLCLFGTLQPNNYYMEVNKNGQLEHFSIEIIPNFAGTGKAYLGGLAITDDPASIGTDAAKLYSAHGKKDRKYSQPIQQSSPLYDDENAVEDMKFFQRMKLFFSNINHSEEDSMKPEQFNQLMDKVDGVVSQVKELQTQVDSFSNTNSAENTQAETDTTSDTGVTDSEVKALADKFSKLEASHNQLKTEHEDLKEKYNKAANEPAGDTTEPDAETEIPNITC